MGDWKVDYNNLAPIPLSQRINVLIHEKWNFQEGQNSDIAMS